MAGVTLTLDASKAIAGLAELVSRLQDPARAWRAIGEDLLRSTDERFRREVAPDGTRWPENSDVTLLRYLAGKGGLSKRRLKSGGQNLTQKGAKLLGDKKILRQSGALQDTIRYQLLPGGQGLAIGTNRIYGAVQQFGATEGAFGRYSQVARRTRYGEKDFRRYAGSKQGFPIPWGTIPPRPYLGLSADDRAHILDTLRRFLLAESQRA